MGPIKELFEENMTRKQFLQFFAVAVLSLFGINNFISLLLKNAQQTHTRGAEEEAPRGFGSSKFGR